MSNIIIIVIIAHVINIYTCYFVFFKESKVQIADFQSKTLKLVLNFIFSYNY